MMKNIKAKGIFSLRMEAKVKELRETAIFEMLAKEDAGLAEMLKEFIEFYISYAISWVEDNIWQFTVFYYLPHGIPATIKMCHDIENGKIMAEEHLQEIFDGMKKLLDN